MAFGTFCSLVSSSPQADSIWIWSLPQVSPPTGQLPWQFGGDEPTPSGATPGVFAEKKQDFVQKMAFGTFYSLVSSFAQADSIRMGSLTQGIPTQWLLQECLFKKLDLVQKTAFGKFYPLVNSSPKADGIIMGYLPEGAPIPMAAPLTMWWRWAHSFWGYSRGVYQKTGFGTKNGIWHILLTSKELPKGGWYHNGVFARKCPIPWAAPLKIWWRWTYSFRGYSRGVCWKMVFGTFCSLVSSSPQADSIRMCLCHRVSPPPGQLPWQFGGDETTPSGDTPGVFTHKYEISYKKWHLVHFTHW